ncbi:transcription factor bHLH30-like [Rutidosis leptorrhynchoides]|uniref:transcription factor bHLH30-like n=1 Tax=Rutidosis leptorrhynchoides TaxID=125765 RepID=UPI003A995284
MNDYSSTNTTFMFPPPPSSSSQIPLIMHHHYHHQPSLWTNLHQPFYPELATFNNQNPFVLPQLTPSYSSSSSSHATTTGLLKRLVDGLQSQVVQPGSDPLRIQTTETTKAIAASKSHSEAEKRRRERINNHLTKLRSLLPNTTKTDKASLLAEVIQHVKELKRQTSIISEKSLVPTEIDELTINDTSDEQGRIVIKASLCCEDRSNLLPDLIKTLKMLRLKTLKAEITTLGRRVKNVLFVTGEEDYSSTINDHEQMVNHLLSVVEEALKIVIEKTYDDDDSSYKMSVKRQRTKDNINDRLANYRLL